MLRCHRPRSRPPQVATPTSPDSVRPGARLALLTWAELSTNQWVTEIRGTLARGWPGAAGASGQTRPDPSDSPSPDYPRRVLGQSGWSGIRLSEISEARPSRRRCGGCRRRLKTDPVASAGNLTPSAETLARTEPGGPKGCCHVEDWAEIRRLHRAEGMPIKVIARALGISRNTVRAALRLDGPPRYERAPAGSVVDEVEPRIRELLQACPTMPATVIAERIGWTRGMTVLKERVRGAAAGVSAAGPGLAHGYVAGEIAQCDFWFPRRSSCRSGSGRPARPSSCRC